MKLSRFILVFCVLFIFSSCQTVSTYSDKLMNAVGLGSANSKNEKKKNTQSKKKKSAKNKNADKEKADQENTEESDSSADKEESASEELHVEMIRQDQTEPQKFEKKKITSAKAPVFKVDAPVNVLRRFGGSARFIAADTNYVYIDFPQHFALYDKNLGKISHVQISYPVLAVNHVIVAERSLFYLKEANNVFEILELVTPENGVPTLKVVQNIEMDGPFEWLSDQLIAVTAGAEVQILDVSNIDDVVVLARFPSAGQGAITKLGDTLYVSRDGYLDLLDTKDYSLKSSLRVGRQYGFLGVVNQADRPVLILSLKNEQGHLIGVQYLNLATDLSHVAGFGETLIFPEALSGEVVDLEQGLILGMSTNRDHDVEGNESESKSENHLLLFSLKEKRFLRGDLDLSHASRFQAWSLLGDSIFLVSPLEIAVSKIQLAAPVLNKSKLVQGIPPQGASPILAQTQPSKRLQDEYQLLPVKKIDFVSDSRKIELLDRNHMILVEQSRDQKSHRLFAVVGLFEENFQMNEIVTKEPLLFDKMLKTDFGLVLYSQAKSKFYLIDVNFDKIEEIGMPVQQNVTSMLWFSRPVGEILVVASEVGGRQAVTEAPAKAKISAASKSIKEKTNSTSTEIDFNKIDSDDEASKPKPLPQRNDGRFVVRIYLLTSSKDVQLLSEIHYTEKVFAFKIDGENLLVASGSFVESIDISDLKKPEQDEDTRQGFSTYTNFIDMKLSPNREWLYGLYTDEYSHKISVIPVRDLSQRKEMTDFYIGPGDFSGMNFGRRGQILILPSQDGTLFFDMTDLNNIKETAHWPLPSHHVASADDGDFLCIALGPKGVYCGTPLF